MAQPSVPSDTPNRPHWFSDAIGRSEAGVTITDISLAVVLILATIFQPNGLTRQRGMPVMMNPEENPNSGPDQLGGPAPDLPPEVLDGPDNRPWLTKFRDRDDRPDLLRPQFATEADNPIDFSTVRAQRAIRYFDLTLVPESGLFDEWDNLEGREQRMYRAALLRELFDDSYEELEGRLKSSGIVAREAGFGPGDVPSDSTLWREIRDLDQETVEEAARRADNAVMQDTFPNGIPLRYLGTRPRKPDFYYEITKHERGISTERKMRVTSEIVAEYMELAIPNIDFDRDRTAPNYQLKPESFYRLLAHIALEDCYAANGSEILRWLSDDDVDVPDSSTLHRYAQKFDVDEHADRFLDATCALLERDGLLPTEPVHLGFDITKVPWYGSVATDEEGNPTGEDMRIKSTLKDNTTLFWPLAVLSITAPDRNYVLGFKPAPAADKYDEVLDSMLEGVTDRLDIEFGRIYFDSGLANTKIMDVCEKHDLNWLIRGEMSGKREELAENLPPATPGGRKKVAFGSDTREINIFACPLHPETVEVKETSEFDNGDDPEYRFLDGFSTENGSDGDGGSETATLERNDTGEKGSGDVEYAERQGVIVRPELKFEEVGDKEKWATWNTNMDVATRDLRGLAYQYRYRWRVETAIRQLKQDFTGRCGSDSPAVRALYFGAGQLFFNFWVALNHELPFQLDHTGVRMTGLEVLHGLREADFEEATAKRRI